MFLFYVITFLSCLLQIQASPKSKTASGDHWIPVQELNKDELLHKLRSSIAQHKYERHQQLAASSETHELRQVPDQTLYAEYGRQASGSTDNTKDTTTAQEKTIFTGVNADSIYSGVFDVNNILIHVAQNFVNIIAGTALWSFFGWLNLPNQRRRSSEFRSLDDEGLFGSYTASDVTWLLRKIADTGDIIASLHDEL